MEPDNQLSIAFDTVSILQLAHELGYHDLKEGAGQRSPFRDDKKAGSFSVQKSYFKDHAHEDHHGGHIAFVQLARPAWSKKECVEFIIRAAGMEPRKQTAGAVKRIAKEKREKLFLRQQNRIAEIQKLAMEAPPPMDAPVRKRWNEGQAAIIDHLAKLADSRGWPEFAMRALVGMNKTSSPKLPWDRGRGWAWLVERPIFDQRGKAALVPVGFHARYKIFASKNDGGVEERRWLYCPYIPQEPKTEFQEYLARAKIRLPAYPFVLGNLSEPRLLIILEGQFDAVSLALAFGWLESGIPPGVVVMGLRGVSSPGVLMAAYGQWLRRHKPFVWLLPDNDVAGRKVVERGNAERIDSEPSFVDRLRAQGCTVRAQFLELPGCKDFNDVWRTHRPSIDQMRALADVAGCGEYVKGD